MTREPLNQCDYENANVYGLTGARSYLMNRLEEKLEPYDDVIPTKQRVKQLLKEIGEKDGISIAHVELNRKGNVKYLMFSNGTWCNWEVDCDSD